MSRFKKIYIDSHHRTYRSASSSDFEIYLPETQECDNNTKLYIHEVSIPNSIYPVQSGLNDILYLRLYNTADFTSFLDTKVILPSGSYIGNTLANTLQTEMRLRTDNFLGQTDWFNVTYNYDRNQITINNRHSLTGTFKIFTDAELHFLNDWQGDPYDRFNTFSLNQVLGNNAPNLVEVNWFSGYIWLLPLRNLYLACDELSDCSQLGSVGSFNIIKKIPVTAPFGSVIYDNEIIGADYVDASNKTLRTLHFKLVNSYGNVVELNNVNVSFSLTFVEDCFLILKKYQPSKAFIISCINSVGILYKSFCLKSV